MHASQSSPNERKAARKRLWYAFTISAATISATSRLSAWQAAWTAFSTCACVLPWTLLVTLRVRSTRHCYHRLLG